MIYTVTFNPALDYTIWAGDISKGGVVRMQRQKIFCGGKGINVSFILKELGLDNVALGFTAGFTGAELERLVQEAGITSGFIRLKSGNTRINVKIKANPEIDINDNGPSIDEAALEKLMRKIDAIEDGDSLVLAGSIPSTMPDDIYEQIMNRLSSKNIDVVVDATGDLLSNVLQYKPFLIKPNNFELEEIVGRKLHSDPEIVKAAGELQRRGARNVLISLGGDGAMLLDEDGVVSRIGVAPCNVVNSVGAGDSMVAGFLAGYIMKHDYQFALKLGTAAGGATAGSEGLASREKITSLLEQI